jgi:5-methyltetrahydrofolate--homocysteine methyltransferase
VAFVDLGGNLDIMASLLSTYKLLFDVHDAPDHVDRLVNTITKLWLTYYNHLYEIIRTGNSGTTAWAQMWAPGSFYMFQSDFSYMISPKMFERYVMPDLTALCDALDYPFYHLDGEGQIHHLDQLLSLEKLAGIQWIPGAGAAPPEEWLPLLKRIRDGGKLCQVYVTPEGARKIVRELGGKGFCFVIFEDLAAEDIDDFLATLFEDNRIYSHEGKWAVEQQRKS